MPRYRRPLLLTVGILFAAYIITTGHAFADTPAQLAAQAQSQFQSCMMPGNGIGSDFTSRSLSAIQGMTDGIAHNATTIALSLFRFLFVIEFCWWLIDTYRHSAARGFTIPELAGGITFKIMSGLTFIAIITWLGASGHIAGIFAGFEKTAEQIVPPTVIAASGHPAVTSANIENGAASIMNTGMCLSSFIVNASVIGGNVGFNVFDISANAILSVVVLMLSILVAIFVAIAFFILAVQLVLALIESNIIATAGLFVLGFTGSRWTLSYGQSIFKYIFSLGIKIFAIFVIAGFTTQLAGLVVQSTVDTLSAPGVNGAYAGGVDFIQLLSFIGLTLLVLMMAIKVPSMASTFITGTPDMNIATAAGVAAGTAAVVAGGAMAAHAVGGKLAAMGAGRAAGGSMAGGGTVPRPTPASNAGGSGERRNTPGDRIRSGVERLHRMSDTSHASAPEIALKHHD